MLYLINIIYKKGSKLELILLWKEKIGIKTFFYSVPDKLYKNKTFRKNYKLIQTTIVNLQLTSKFWSYLNFSSKNKFNYIHTHTQNWSSKQHNFASGRADVERYVEVRSTLLWDVYFEEQKRFYMHETL